MDGSNANAQRRPGLGELGLGFLQIALCSVGGAWAWAHHFIVERKRWLTEAEFTDAAGLAQVVPGPNVGNLSILLGDRFAGPLGAVVCFAAFILVPTAIAVVLDALLMRWIHAPLVAPALAGVGAAAGGLVVATALRMAVPFRLQPAPLLLAALAFAGAGPLHLPLLAVVGALVPFGLLWAWRTS